MALTISPDVTSRVPELLGVSIGFGLLTFITICLRLWARLKVVGQGLQIDDYTIMVAAGLAIYFCINVPQQTTFGLGYHIEDLTIPTYFNGSLKLFYVGELVYYFCVMTTKFSLVALYLRFFTTKKLIITAWATIIFTTLTGFSFVIVIAFQCKPIAYAWDKSLVGGKCVDVTAVFYSHAAINIVTDIVVYIMPMKTLWGISRPQKEKIGLVVMFGVGFFVCIAGIIRLWALQRTSVSQDPSWDNEPSAIWSIIECCVGVICASIPSLKPLFSKMQRNAGTNASYKLSEHSQDKLGARKYTNDDNDLLKTSNWDQELAVRSNNIEGGNSPTSSTAQLVDEDLSHVGISYSQSGIYKSTKVMVSHTDELKRSDQI